MASRKSLMLVVVVQGKEMISIDKDYQREQGGGASHIGSDPQRCHPRAMSPDGLYSLLA